MAGSRHLLQGLKHRHNGVEAVFRGTILVWGCPGLGAPSSDQAGGDVFCAEVARMGSRGQAVGSRCPGVGRAPRQTAVPSPEVSIWKELGDDSLSDIWSLRFLWNVTG